MLVVIAIIAILAAILFPVFAQAREKARQTNCASNQKQVGLGMLQYMTDYDGVVPLFRTQDQFFWNNATGGRVSFGVYSEAGRATGTYWPSLIQPYMKSYALFGCTSEQNSSVLDTGFPGYIQYGPNFGINAEYLYKTLDGNCKFIYVADPANTRFPAPVSDSDIKSPAGTVAFADLKQTVTATATGISSYSSGGYLPSPAATTAPDCCVQFT
ncbi:MAG: DUF1559 domain-containing protein, partial [Armatimonadota bacterium]